MDRMTKAVIGGYVRPLNYSVSVMFDMMDKYGNIQKALDVLQSDTRDSFDAVQWFAVKMANDAELYFREAGYDSLPFVTDKDIPKTMAPIDYADLRSAVVDAIAAGYQREVKGEGENEEVDLGLAELRAKKAMAGA